MRDIRSRELFIASSLPPRTPLTFIANSSTICSRVFSFGFWMVAPLRSISPVSGSFITT
jgi:hypothetical protein